MLSYAGLKIVGDIMAKKKRDPNYEVWRKQRGDWGAISPVTKVIPNKKKNPKTKYKNKEYENV